MLRRAVVALMMLAWVATASAQPTQTHRSLPLRYMTTIAPPSQQFPMVVLVTMGIGSLIWERHGHIALCVLYENQAQDSCYNYGVGDFHDPGAMAWGFFRGTHSFWVDRQDPESMLRIYRYVDRTIWAQIIPLGPEQVKKVIAKLESDILEENKYYAYDHFADNCTTRVRDILDGVTNGALAKMPEIDDGKTFRDLARDGFYGMRVPLLITDIAMGRSTDREPSYWERMFLPQYLREAAAKAWNLTPTIIYERKECRVATGDALAECNARGIPNPDESPSGRVLFALLIIALTSPAWITRKLGKLQRTGMAIAIIPPALLGLVFWVLAVISPLPYVRWNESILVFMPIDLLVLFLPGDKKARYARARVAMLGLFAVLHLVTILKQPLFAPMLWPLIPLAVAGWWPAKTTTK